MDTLSRLTELQQRFNGPIPDPLMQVAIHGTPEAAALCLAEGQSAFFTAMVKGQLKILRYAKASGWIPAYQVTDFILYWRKRREWRVTARGLRRIVDAQLAARRAHTEAHAA